MKRINLQIAIVTIISLLVSAFAPIAYATTKEAQIAITTKDVISNETTEENENKTEETENKITKDGEAVVVVDDKIEGVGQKEIRLEFSAQNMPNVEIKRIYKDKLQGLGTGFNVLYNGKIITNSDEIIKNAKGNITLEISDKNGNVVKTVYIVKRDADTTKYNITTNQNKSEGVVFKNNTLKLERGKTSYKFVYENGKENILSDVTVTISDNKVAEIIKGEYGEVKIKALTIGKTTLIFEGKSVKNGKQTINVEVVKSLYTKPSTGSSNSGNTTKPNTGNTSSSNTENTNNSNISNQENTNKPNEEMKDDNNRDENKDDTDSEEEYTFVKYDEREDVYSDYTKLNEELIQKTDKLEVTVEGNHSVKADVFKTLKKYPNKKLVINSSASGIGRITWEFDSNTITNTNIDFKPSAHFSTEKLNSIKNDDKTEGIYMDLAHNGKLPGKAEVSLWLGEELANKYMEEIKKEVYLYYYNPTTRKYEFVGNAKMADYGTIEFQLDHCSIYLFSSSKLEGKTSRPLDEEPKTGVENYVGIACVVAVISLTGIILLKRNDCKYKAKRF